MDHQYCHHMLRISMPNQRSLLAKTLIVHTATSIAAMCHQRSSQKLNLVARDSTSRTLEEGIDAVMGIDDAEDAVVLASAGDVFAVVVDLLWLNVLDVGE